MAYGERVSIVLTGYLERDENVRFTVKGPLYETISFHYAGRNQKIGEIVQTAAGWRVEYAGPGGQPAAQRPDLGLEEAEKVLVEHYRKEYGRVTARMREVNEWARRQRRGEDGRREKEPQRLA